MLVWSSSCRASTIGVGKIVSKTEFEIFEGEIDSGGGYTIDSLRAIQLKNPGAEITIAMGEDVFWKIRVESPVLGRMQIGY